MSLSLGKQMTDALLASPDLGALINGRVYPNQLPQNEPLPAVTFFTISDVPNATLTTKSRQLLRQARVQVDAYAKTYKEVKAVEDAVMGALDLSEPSPGLSVIQELARDFYDASTGFHRVQMEFNVWR